ncbi:MAG: hypothetical protein LIP06_05695 [Tannerellaceae bacterium]|nr:hypothetical protein [Tannerellaceae bacterium]
MKKLERLKLTKFRQMDDPELKAINGGLTASACDVPLYQCSGSCGIGKTCKYINHGLGNFCGCE